MAFIVPIYKRLALSAPGHFQNTSFSSRRWSYTHHFAAKDIFYQITMASLQLSTAERNKVRALWGEAMAMKDYKTEQVINELFTELCHSSDDARDLFENKKVRAEQEKLFSEIMGFTMMYLHNLDVLDECINEFIKENPHVVRCGVRYLEPMGGVMIQYLRSTLGPQFHAGLETLWVKTYIYIANCILQNEELDVELLLSATGGRSSESETELLEETAPLKVPARSASRASAASPPVEQPQPQPEPQAPSFKSSPLPRLQEESAGNNTIQINLQNEKYKGFRRSVTESPKEPVLVKVPATFVKQPAAKAPSMPQSPRQSLPVSEGPFDPRSKKRSSGASNLSHSYSFNDAVGTEPQLTPRSSRRDLAAQLQELGLGLDTDDFEVKSKTAPFDPRRSLHHRRTSSDLGSSMEHPLPESALRSWSGSSCESPILDVEDEFNLAPPEEDYRQKRQNQVFDSNSFGIKGLAPIAETEVDEETSDYDNSQKDGSSRTSSLSLHNLDYKSSISLGLGYSPDVAKNSNGYGFRNHNTKMSQLSDISFMQSLPAPSATAAFPMMHRDFGSTPSLSTRSMYTPGKRASLGFMRSSFVLKKEMEELGYNHAENVSLLNVSITEQAPREALAPPYLARLTASRSVSSLPLQPSAEAFAPAKAQPARTPAVNAAPAAPRGSTDKKKKHGFRAKLGSIFGSSKEQKQPLKLAHNKISAPISVPIPPSSKGVQKEGTIPVKHHAPVRRPAKAPTPAQPSLDMARRGSMCSSTYDVSTINTTSRVSASDVRRQSKQAPPAGYAASVYSRPVVNDNESVYSNELTVSGFSFFKSKSKLRYESFDDQKKKKNKYNVKKVPYKTVYVKDFVR